VIVDFREEMSGACRNHDNVPGFQVVRDAVPDLGSVVARSVELTNSLLRGRPALTVRDIGTQHERRRSLDDVVDLAHLIVLGH
jgi:hypothetical protein